MLLRASCRPKAARALAGVSWAGSSLPLQENIARWNHDPDPGSALGFAEYLEAIAQGLDQPANDHQPEAETLLSASQAAARSPASAAFEARGVQAVALVPDLQADVTASPTSCYENILA